MAETPFKYDFMRYDHRGLLRAGWPVKLVLVFLCRHLLFLLAFVGMNFKGRGGAEMQHLLPLLDRAFIVSDLPALLVLIALGARRPGASAAYRWLWHRGRALILGSVGLFLVITALRHGVTGAPMAAVEWVMVALNAAIAVYVVRSEYVRDLFADFPPPDGDDA